MTSFENTINVGQLIKNYIDTKRIAKSAVARKIGKYDATIVRYQKNASLKTEVLLALSHAMEHNFFADIAALLPSHYTTDAPVDNTATSRIAELELQVKLLEAEKAVLLEAIKK